MSKSRSLAAVLTLSVAGWAAWVQSEGLCLTACIPTKDDVPTIGHGSTRYEDGTPVTLGDPPITRERAVQLAKALHRQEEQRFIDSIPGVALHQEEFDLYQDFVGNFGIGNWRSSSMRRHLIAGEYEQACRALLAWRKQAGRDCSLPQNWGPQGCKGVWTRQQHRHAKCMAVQ